MGDRPCSLLINYGKMESIPASELKNMVENGNLEEKVQGLKRIVLMALNGESTATLLMPVIRFIMPSKNHLLKKLLLIYWEVVAKNSAEFLLVCNSLRNDLNHPNEYVRGVTLRFLCKLKEPDLLEPLVPSIRQNLEHRLSYVRRNAVLAVHAIYRDFEHLIPDAPEVIREFLDSEADLSCKRNALMTLYHAAPDTAVEYLNTILDDVESFPDTLQFYVVEMIRKVCRTRPLERPRYVKAIYCLLNSPSPAVQFEAACTLSVISTAAPAVRAAAQTLIRLLTAQSDHNVRLVALEKLADIKRASPKGVGELVMDILSTLSPANMEQAQKTLDLSVDLVTSANAEAVMGLLKKEISRTHAADYEQAPLYRKLLVQAIRTCVGAHPKLAHSAVLLLLDFLGDRAGPAAFEVVSFVRETMASYPALAASLVPDLVQSLRDIEAPKVFRGIVWLLGEFAESSSDSDAVLAALHHAIVVEPTPSAMDPSSHAAGDAMESTSTRKVLADGTYATSSAWTEQDKTVKPARRVCGLLGHVAAGDLYLGAVAGVAATKVALRRTATGPCHRTLATALLVVVRLLRSVASQEHADSDSHERLLVCAHILAKPSTHSFARTVFLDDCRQAFRTLLQEQRSQVKRVRAPPARTELEGPVVAPDALLNIRQLQPTRLLVGAGELMADEIDVSQAMMGGAGFGESEDASRLARVQQLSGYSDPIYVEARVRVHQYDITLDFSLLNRTPHNLQNVSVELATLGDLKLVERPQGLSMAPYGAAELRAHIKVASTESGVIFGTVVYDVTGRGVVADGANCVVLDDIHIDIMDYIHPAVCTDTEFRAMWAEFEWENKISVSSALLNPIDYVRALLAGTNMSCLTESALAGDCDFLSANLYARSIFGEDALASVSVERTAERKLAGFIRIRSKTQGIALSLGDKISHSQSKSFSAAGASLDPVPS